MKRFSSDWSSLSSESGVSSYLMATSDEEYLMATGDEEDEEYLMATGDEEEQGETIFYLSRHEHGLCLFKGLPKYTCSGCKEFGAKIGYKCLSCDKFTLHEACFEFYEEVRHWSERVFKFRRETHLSHRCDACQDVLKGFVFEAGRPDRRDVLKSWVCQDESPDHLRLHPLCMELPEYLHYDRHEEHPQLRLLSGHLKGDKYCCSRCHKNNTGWRYECEAACQFRLDLSCAKIYIYDLSKFGIPRVARMGRRRKLRSKVSSVKWKIASALCVATMSAGMEALVGSLVG